MKIKAVVIIVILLLLIKKAKASNTGSRMSEKDIVNEAKKFLVKKEGFSRKAIYDVNAWRIGYGSDTIVIDKSGMFRTVREGDVTTQELAEIDLSRRIESEFIPKVKKKIGGEIVWKKLPSGMKVALISFAYNYGNIVKKAIVDAVKAFDGNTRPVAEAWINSTFDDNKRLPEKMRNALRERRKEEVRLFHEA